MAGDVDVGQAGVHHLGAQAVEAVDHLVHAVLVAGDGVGADDDHVAVADLEPLVLPRGHEGQGRHGLALGAGGDHAHPPGVVVADALDVDQGGVGDVSRPIWRARATFLAIDRPRVATTRPLAMAASAICWTRWMWLAKQAVMTRLSVCSANRLRRTLPTDRLAGGVARLLGVGGVGEQQPDAGPAARAPMRARSVHAPVDRREVDLEVARVQDHALGGVEGGGEAVGHRVGDGDELAVEGTDPPPLAVGHRDELGAVEEAGLLDAVAGQAQGELRAVDRERQVAQQVRQRAHVVLVAVGDDATLDPVGVLPQPGEVGQHQVDAGHLGVGEHQAAVEDA